MVLSESVFSLPPPLWLCVKHTAILPHMYKAHLLQPRLT